MGVTRPGEGDGITKVSVQQMHTDARGLANAVPYSALGVDALGDQHLPSVLVGATPADYAEVTSNVVVAGANPFASETLVDIRTNWLELAPYVLNNSGPGYVLPPCKVFAFCCLTIDAITNGLGNTTRDQALYLVLGREDSVDTGVFHADLADIGTVFVPQNKLGYVAGERFDEPWHTVTIATVIDRTSLGSNWTLEKLTIRAASAQHGDGAYATFRILHGSIGFFALYRDS